MRNHWQTCSWGKLSGSTGITRKRIQDHQTSIWYNKGKQRGIYTKAQMAHSRSQVGNTRFKSRFNIYLFPKWETTLSCTGKWTWLITCSNPVQPKGILGRINQVPSAYKPHIQTVYLFYKFKFQKFILLIIMITVFMWMIVRQSEVFCDKHCEVINWPPKKQK